MTVLRARALDSQGNPVAGRTAVLEAWTGNRYKNPYSGPSAVRGLTAVSGSDGWLSWTLPDLQRRPGPRGSLWVITGLEAQPVVLATQPTDTTTTGIRVGTVNASGDLVPVPAAPPVDTAAQAAAAAQTAVGAVTAGAPASLDTLAEVAAELQGRLSAAALGAVFMPLGTPGDRSLQTADVSGAPSPTALAFKRWFAKRHFFDVQLPVGSLDLSFSPLLANGSPVSQVAVVNGGMTVGYSGGNLTLGHTTDATQTEGSVQFLDLHPFATYELTVASWTASVYGNMGWEFRSADGTKRIIAVYSKSGGRVQIEYLLNNVSQGLMNTGVVTVTGGFTLRVQLQGRSANIWITTGGTTTYGGRLDLVGLDLRDPAQRTGWTAGIVGRGHTDFTFAVSDARAYLAGNGHADLRIVSYEDGTPIQSGETVWLLATTRGVDIPDAYQGVYAYNTATGQLTHTGAIFCNRGDGIARNENAGHLFYDRTVSKWRYLGIGHSDYPGARLVWLSTTDTDLRFGINTTPVSQVNIVGDDGVTTFYEDMYPIFDTAAGKWVATASKNASISSRLEATSPLGPWTEVATGGTSETGNLIVKMGSSRYILAGGAAGVFVARNYTTLASLGNLSLDYATGGSRVWPVVFPVRTGSGTRWHMLSFDRTSPAGSYSYGRVVRYRA